MPTFTLEGQRLAYTVHGDGPRPIVLLHGLLFSQRMHEALARALAGYGNRVVTLDLLGHGESDRPYDQWRYSMPAYGRQVVALLDELGDRDAVILGTSLGANVALEVAAQAPRRVRGMVIEMPVLDHALLGCALAFTPLMVALTFGEPGMRALALAARTVPRRRLPWQLDILLDWIRQDPAPSAAVLPDARLLQARSLLELRVAPRRLTGEIARFLDECWRRRPAAVRTAAS